MIEKKHLNVMNHMISAVEHLNEPWGIKDNKSRHIFMNDAARLYTCTPPKFDLEGQYDYAFPTSWAEHSVDFVKHDRLTQQANKTVSVIETDYWYGSDHLEPYICDKIPILDSTGVCAGTLWNVKRVKIISPLIYIGEKDPSLLQTQYESGMFTEAEMDIIFLLLRKMRTIEIANCLNLTVETLDYRIKDMYRKCGILSRSQFEQYCRQLDLHNFVPQHLLKKGVLFI